MKKLTLFLFLLFLVTGCVSTGGSLEQTRSELEQVINTGINGEKAKVIIQNGKVRARISNSILFDLGKFQVKSQFKPIILRLANYLKSHPSMTLIIEGHADKTGAAAYNKTLSENRAKAVKQVFISSGVIGNKINTIGYGENKPIAGASDSQNRRVEIIFQDSKEKIASEQSTINKLVDQMKIKEQSAEQKRLAQQANKLMGKRVQWRGAKSIESDDCALWGLICHSVGYDFKYMGTVVEVNNTTYSVKLSAVQLLGPAGGLASLSHGKYTGRARNWGESQVGTVKSIEFRYVSRM